MTWLAKLKAKAQEHTILGLFALIGLLSLIVWKAVPSAVWDKVSEVTPKRALWALLALTAIAAILEGAYVAHLHRKFKLKPRFGALWDRNLTPYCPAHKDIALGNWGNPSHGPHGYICPQGEHVIPLQDDEGNYLKPTDAKARLRADPNVPASSYEPDDIGQKILIRLARPNSDVTLDHLTNHLRLHPERVKHYLSELENHGYLWSSWVPMAPTPPTTYHLAEKGRAFLMSKNLI